MLFVQAFAKRWARVPADSSSRLFFLAMGGVAMLAASALAGSPYYSAHPPGYSNPYYGPGYATMAPYRGPVSPYGSAAISNGAAGEISGVAQAAPGHAISPNRQAAAPAAGFGRGSTGLVPTMIGDFVGYGGFLQARPISGLTPGVAGGNVSIAGGDRRFKVAENQSPVPADRFYYTYHYFDNALHAIDGLGNHRQVNFERYTLGIEKTLFRGLMSVEVRVPFGHGLESDLFGAPAAGLTGTELGNLVVVAKGCLLRRPGWTTSAGLGVSVPTADDARQIDSDGFLHSEIKNESVHLQPFISWIWTPTDRCFVEAFSSLDLDVNGYDVYMDNNRGSMERVGTYDDQMLSMFDLKFGYWLYRDPCGSAWISGIIPTVELHSTTTLENYDDLESPGDEVIFDPLNEWYNLNLTFGVHTQIVNGSVLTFYGVVPLHDDEDPRTGIKSNFDGEVGVQFNRYF